MSVDEKRDEIEDFDNDLEIVNEESESYKAFRDFQDLTNNLDGKTILSKPQAIVALHTFQHYLSFIEYTISANSLEDIIETTKKLNISKDGIGREQAIKMYESLNHSTMFRNDELKNLTRPRSII